jgi:hypothetical protein
MMECGWYQLLSTATARQGEGWRLLRISARRGVSAHRPRRGGDSRYPERYSRRVGINWDAEPREHWVLCSRAAPAALFRSDDGTWIAHRLDFFDMAGFTYSSAYIYLDACHGLGREALEDQARLRRLGYTASGSTQQLELSRPEEILEQLPR